MESTSRICDKNLLPNPSPWLAPLTSPAISTNSMDAGTARWDLLSSESTWRRGSGTATIPTFGSIVQKGKLAACAFPFSTTALKRVDFPTLGSPTIPAFKLMLIFEQEVEKRRLRVP